MPLIALVRREGAALAADWPSMVVPPERRADPDDGVRDDSALLSSAAGGDEQAFAHLYDLVGPRVFGIVRRVLRDPAQSEEVTQEVFLEVWRTAARFDADRGSALTWILTIAHRRAVDRVRSAQAASDREHLVGARDRSREYDEVSDTVERRLEAQSVRRCLDQLTPLQRESVTLAYYRGLTYSEVAEALGAALGTVKTRMRDGLIRLRDCLGVTA